MTGVVLQPYRGYQNGGVAGLAKGVALGVTGLMIKPAAGFLELTSKTAGGISGGIKKLGDDVVKLPRSRVRTPRGYRTAGGTRSVGGNPMGPAAPWVQLLAGLDKDELSQQHVVDYIQLRAGKGVILTENYVLYVKTNSRKLRWMMRLDAVFDVQAVQNELNLSYYWRPKLMDRLVAIPQRRKLVCSSKDLA